MAYEVGTTMRQPESPPLVLMVEDEPLLRLHAAEALPPAGFRLVAAARADEALAQLRQLAGEVAVAVVDLGLPDLPGEQLARQLREIRPALPIVVASGYSRRRLRNLFAGMDDVVFLEKPYGTAELLAALERLHIAPDPSAGAENTHAVAGK